MRARRKSRDVQEVAAIAFSDCPAKTLTLRSGEVQVGRTVLDHCTIVGETARELISRMPTWLSDKLFPAGSALLAGLHDLGKVSPCFAEKIMRATDGYTRNSHPYLKLADPDIERQWGGHAGVTQVHLESISHSKYVAEIAGRHHGYSPNVGMRSPLSEDFGGESWYVERERLVKELKLRLNENLPVITTNAQSLAVSGLTTVSDWIGSSQAYEDPTDTEWRKKIPIALDDAGFIKPQLNKGMSFKDVFGFDPRESQTALIEKAIKPGVFIMEAPMGLGKTEGALYVAYKMMEAGLATGIYFALPTQLTSNKIYSRFNQFLKTILAPGSEHTKSLLLHGGADLLETTELGEEGKPGGSWFGSAKRGLLAPFAVGTADQALMSVMNVKHGFVRAFGLAGKVVILDEVHSYDSYTGTILEQLVSTLRELGCTVIILSATLSSSRRAELLDSDVTVSGYPLITASPNDGLHSDIEIDMPETHEVAISVNSEDSAAFEEAIKRANEGQQVLWIENTVGEAQSSYQLLAARGVELGIECGLIHSRFTSEHRKINEDYWVSLYGPEGHDKRSLTGRILVGTQVLEQSIDIDSDFLVTRICPSDMLLQRLGRLWRHENSQKPTPRAASSVCEVMILCPGVEAFQHDDPNKLPLTGIVYSPFVLCRTIEVWGGLKSIKLPCDIREVIEDTYRDREETPVMNKLLNELENGIGRRIGRKQLKGLASVTLSVGGTTLSDAGAQTRYDEGDSGETLLISNWNIDSSTGAYILTMLDGHDLIIPRNWYSLSKHSRREISAALSKFVVKMRLSQAPPQESESFIRATGIHNCFYFDFNQDDSNIRLGLVASDGEVTSWSGRANNKFLLSYNDTMGLITQRKNHGK